MKQQEKDEKRRKISKGAASGATAIIFFIIGFQAAVLVLKLREEPACEQADVQVQESAVQVRQERGQKHFQPSANAPLSPRRHSPAYAPKAEKPVRKVESFRFDPNRVTQEELVRLGLSEKQADAILNYREKGGKFRSKADFQKMYTVSDSLYERLEPFIDIPKVELNSADSTALVSLKGIGPYYARKIIAYREALGGFVEIGQLLEVKGMDSARFEGLKESVKVDTSLVHRFLLDTVSEELLARHPYFGKNATKAIVRLRKFEKISDSILVKESILDSNQVYFAKKYAIFDEK